MHVPREEIAKLHFQWSHTVDFFPPVFTDCSANTQQLSMKGRLLKKIFANVNFYLSKCIR